MSRVEPARLDAVDGLRALAMTMVVAQHCALLPVGWTGVWLFYVISGYVISRGFLLDEPSPLGVRERWLDFLWRRALRIVPAYLLYLALNAPVLLATGRAEALGDLPYLLSFTHNWHMVFGFWPGASDWPPFGHLWTVSVEQQFYLLFPLLALAAPARLRTPLTVALVALGPVLRWGFGHWLALRHGDPGWLAYAVYAATPCHVDAFLAGSLVARLEPRWRVAPARASNALWLVAALIALGHVAGFVAVNRALGAEGVDAWRNVLSGVVYGEGREVTAYLAIDALALAALVHALAGRRAGRWLGWAPLASIGRASYGAYLYHALALWLALQAVGVPRSEMPPAMRLALFAFVWPLTVALAELSFRAFERPLMKAGRAWRGARRGAALAGARAT